MFTRPKLKQIPEQSPDFVPKERPEDFVLVGPPTLLMLYHAALREVAYQKQEVKRISYAENVLWHRVYDNRLI